MKPKSWWFYSAPLFVHLTVGIIIIHFPIFIRSSHLWYILYILSRIYVMVVLFPHESSKKVRNKSAFKLYHLFSIKLLKIIPFLCFCYSFPWNLRLSVGGVSARRTGTRSFIGPFLKFPSFNSLTSYLQSTAMVPLPITKLSIGKYNPSPNLLSICSECGGKKKGVGRRTGGGLRKYRDPDYCH